MDRGSRFPFALALVGIYSFSLAACEDRGRELNPDGSSDPGESIQLKTDGGGTASADGSLVRDGKNNEISEAGPPAPPDSGPPPPVDAQVADAAPPVDAAPPIRCLLELQAGGGMPRPDCFGPKIDVENHPNYDPMFPYPPANTTLPDFDTGLWPDSVSGGENGCGGLTHDWYRDQVLLRVERGSTLIQQLQCITDLADLKSVAANTPLSLMSLIAANADVMGATLTSATVAYSSALYNGEPALTYNLVFEFTAGKETNTVELALAKYPPMPPPAASGAIVRASSLTHTTGGSIAESQARVLTFTQLGTHKRAELVEVLFAPPPAAAVFNADGSLDDSSAWQYGLMRIGLEITGANEATQLLAQTQLAKIDAEGRVVHGYSTGASLGSNVCAFYGFGEATAKSLAGLAEPTIDRFFCNFAGPRGGQRKSMPLAQKQCLARLTGGSFKVEVDNTTYAPVNDCSFDAATAPNFRYKLAHEPSFPSPQPSITHNLVALGQDPDYAAFKMPTTPTLPSPDAP